MQATTNFFGPREGVFAETQKNKRCCTASEEAAEITPLVQTDTVWSDLQKLVTKCLLAYHQALSGYTDYVQQYPILSQDKTFFNNMYFLITLDGYCDGLLQKINATKLASLSELFLQQPEIQATIDWLEALDVQARFVLLPQYYQTC